MQQLEQAKLDEAQAVGEPIQLARAVYAGTDRTSS